jgi:hypothetical protein
MIGPIEKVSQNHVKMLILADFSISDPYLLGGLCGPLG